MQLVLLVEPPIFLEDNSVPYRSVQLELTVSQVKWYRNTTDSYHPKYLGILSHFGSSSEFWCVSAVNLFWAGTR